ncbi:MAG TPA: universal stress protein [Streptomyces sp.]|nr:universal stress protein [Streptomyces sp.]
MLRPVTVGVDGSPQSLAAASWAAREARLRIAPFRILHAWRWSPHPPVSVPANASQRQWAGRILREAEAHVHALYPDLDVEERQAADTPAAALQDASATSQLLVLGSRGVSGFTGFLVGSVALHVVARAECPVVLVRAGAEGQDAHAAGAEDQLPGRPSHEDVVVGIDLTHPCDEIIEFAYEAARRRGAGVRFVHAYAPPTIHAVGTGAISGPELAAEREQTLAAVVQQWQNKAPDVTATQILAQGRAAQHLLHEATGAGLLVLGRRRRRSHTGLHNGPITHAAMHHAPCPVAVVPHD